MVNDDGIKELANAVILQACRDYYDKTGLISKGLIEDFFHSGWFSLLSRGSVEGNLIIAYLQENEYDEAQSFYYRVKEKER